MGTINWSLAKFGVKGVNLRGKYVASGATTTNNTTQANLDTGAAGGGADVQARQSDVLSILPDTAGRINFGGEPASATVGHIFPANVQSDFEVPANGTITVIDLV